MDQLESLTGYAAPTLAAAGIAYWLLKRNSKAKLPLCSPVRLSLTSPTYPR